MAAPAAPAIGTRCLYFPAAPTIKAALGSQVVGVTSPGGFSPDGGDAPDLSGNSITGQPAIVLVAGTVSPDFQGTQLLVFDRNGQTFIRSGMMSTTSWTAAGSPPHVAHWQMSDALA